MFFAQYIAQTKYHSATEMVKDTHKCAQKPWDSLNGLNATLAELHRIILSWKAHLQVKIVDIDQVKRNGELFIDKVLFCNLSSLLVSMYPHQ